jgi:phage tail-like protein
MRGLAEVTLRLVVDGLDLGSWSKVDGLDTAWGTVDYQPSHESLAAFLNRYAVMGAPISLKLAYRGTISPRLWMWYQQTRGSSIAPRKNCSLELLSTGGQPVARWKMVNAWPKKIEGPSITSGSGRSSSGTVTITTEFIQRVSV